MKLVLFYCEKGSNGMTDQEKTLKKIETAMRRWINKQIPLYKQMPAAQTVTTTQGERVLRANPALAEIRGAFRDYCYLVRTMEGMNAEEETHSSIEEMKKKLKLVK